MCMYLMPAKIKYTGYVLGSVCSLISRRVKCPAQHGVLEHEQNDDGK